QDDHCCWKKFSPLFFQQQNGAPQENENNSRFLAERAQKEQRPGDKKENPSILTGRAQTAYSGIEAQEPKRRSEWIRSSGDVNSRCRVHRMNGPCERGQERDAPPFSFLDSK